MMMTNMLILIGLILCVSSSVDSLELGKICFRDVFEYGRPGYNALEVNSFYRIPTSVSLDPNESLAMFNFKNNQFFLSSSVQYSKCCFILFY